MVFCDPALRVQVEDQRGTSIRRDDHGPLETNIHDHTEGRLDGKRRIPVQLASPDLGASLESGHRIEQDQADVAEGSPRVSR